MLKKIFNIDPNTNLVEYLKHKAIAYCNDEVQIIDISDTNNLLQMPFDFDLNNYITVEVPFVMINNIFFSDPVVSVLNFRSKGQEEGIGIGEQGANYLPIILKELNLTNASELIGWGFQIETKSKYILKNQIFRIIAAEKENDLLYLTKLCIRPNYLFLPSNYPLLIKDIYCCNKNYRKIPNGIALGIKTNETLKNKYTVKFFYNNDTQSPNEDQQVQPEQVQPEQVEHEQVQPEQVEPEQVPALQYSDSYSCIQHCPGGLHRRASGKLTYPANNNGFPFSGNLNNPGSSISGVMRCVNKIQNVRRGSIQTNFLENNLNNLGSSEGSIGGYGRGPRNTF